MINVTVPNTLKNCIMEDDGIKNMISEEERGFGDAGRILVRPSGTEPLVRVMAEGRDAGIVEKSVNRIARAIELLISEKE